MTLKESKVLEYVENRQSNSEHSRCLCCLLFLKPILHNTSKTSTLTDCPKIAKLVDIVRNAQTTQNNMTLIDVS